jgi:hypothetical protein
VSNLITDWRTALVTLLKASFPTADVIAGEWPETPIGKTSSASASVARDKDRIAVFWPGMAEAANVNFAQPRMTIRFWKKLTKTALKPVPRDEGELEQAAWDLALALQPVQTTLDPGQRYYFRVTQILPVRDEHAVEAQLIAWTKNPASIATP